MSVMMAQTKCKLNNTELFLKLFHNQCKESITKKQQNFMRFRLNIDVTKEIEDSRLNSIESFFTFKTDYVRKRSTEF